MQKHKAFIGFYIVNTDPSRYPGSDDRSSTKAIKLYLYRSPPRAATKEVSIFALTFVSGQSGAQEARKLAAHGWVQSGPEINVSAKIETGSTSKQSPRGKQKKPGRNRALIKLKLIEN